MMRPAIPRLALILVAVLAVAAAPAAADDGAVLQPVPGPGTTFASPVYVASPPGDPGRVFVAERAGRVMLVQNGAVEPIPFLDLSAQVESTPTNPSLGVFSENGLSSIVFAPDYATSGRFYAFFTDRTRCRAGTIYCDDRLVELRRSATDPDVADPTTMRTLLVVPRPGDYAVHRGGQLQFDADGRLYVSTGDGGPPHDVAQDHSALNGKLLRLDPAATDPQPELVALGLRNPFRFSFDHVTGDLLLGDVGESRREEVDFLPAEATAGANFGWPACEGDLAFPSGDPCPAAPVASYVAPKIAYAHGSPCSSVTGGVVARDFALPALAGRYVYGDYCQDNIWSSAVSAAGASPRRDTGLAVPHVVAFGQDSTCRIYVVSLEGYVYRLEPAAPDAPAHGCPAAQARGAFPNAPRDIAGSSGSPDTAAPSPVVDRVAPRLTAVSLSRRRFAAGARVGHGTVLRFGLSERATVALRVYSVRRTRIARYRLRGVIVRAGLAPGRHTLRFSGAVGGRRLPPGRYRATLRARDRAGNVSAGRGLTFTIVA